MNWKKYKALPDNEKRREEYYIIGLDLGNDSSGMAFYNLATNQPEGIDPSGGYGKPSIPTVMQYINDTNEWVFGEYAVLNRGSGTEITISSLMERLGNFDYIDVNKRSLSVASILALFIKELLSNVKNINPKAEFVGIVATVPAYFSEQAYEELSRAFTLAGYEKELISLVPDRECVLAHLFQNLEQIGESMHTMLLDFGARELRGGLYHVENTDNNLHITSLSSLFNNEINTTRINNDIAHFFETCVLREIGKAKPISQSQLLQIKEHISAFTYQHKDILLGRTVRTKPAKLYFNFTYPPFQQAVTNDEVEALVKPYSRRFNTFVKSVFEKSISSHPLQQKDIDIVLCVGGGFEMLWAREAAIELFESAQVSFPSNPKMITCEGAAIIAAGMLGLREKDEKFTIEDAHQLTVDIGLTDGKNFFPLVERNAFWWQNHASKLMLVNKEVDGELSLNLCMRTTGDEIKNLGNLKLIGLPKRPKGTTRLKIGLEFTKNDNAIVKIRDMGFGELFPQSDFEKDVAIQLK